MKVGLLHVKGVGGEATFDIFSARVMFPRYVPTLNLFCNDNRTSGNVLTEFEFLRLQLLLSVVRL